MDSSNLHRNELAPRRAGADIGVTGLAVMGHNFARHGHVVAVHNRSPQRTLALVRRHGHEDEFVPAALIQGLRDHLVRIPTSALTGPEPSTSPGPGTASSTPHNDRARSLEQGQRRT